MGEVVFQKTCVFFCSKKDTLFRQKEMQPQKVVLARNLILSSSYPPLFLGFGFCITLIGPTLTDMANQVHVTLPDIAFSFTTRGIVSLILSLVMGKVFDVLHKRSFVFSHALLHIATILCAISFGCIPLVTQYWLLVTLVSSCGFITVYNLGISYFMAFWWKQKAIIGMNLSQGFFGMGCAMSPLVLSFLRRSHASYSISYYVAAVVNIAVVTYSIIAVVVASLLHVFVLKEKLIHFSTEEPLAAAATASSSTPKSNGGMSDYLPTKDTLREMGYFAFCGAALFFLMGFEISFSGLFSVYLEMVHSVDKQYISLLYTLYFISSTVSRLLVSVLSRFTSPNIILAISSSGCIITSFIFALWSREMPFAMIWVLTSCLGISFAPLLPTTLSYPASTFINLKITASRTAIVVFGMSLGGALIPLLITNLCSLLGMHHYFYLMAIIFSTVGFVFISLMFISTWHNQNQILATKAVAKQKEVELKEESKQTEEGN